MQAMCYAVQQVDAKKLLDLMQQSIVKTGLCVGVGNNSFQSSFLLKIAAIIEQAPIF